MEQIEELGNKELELYSKVCSLHGTIEEKKEQLLKLGVFDEYKKIHKQYAELSFENLEALKRGLFLIWYSSTEPSIYTGINDLDKNAGEEIIKVLKKLIDENNTDDELDWMLNYYRNWEFAFAHFQNYKEVQNIFKNQFKVELPVEIDKEKMKQRGQMGIYWNSLEVFK